MLSPTNMLASREWCLPVPGGTATVHFRSAQCRPMQRSTDHVTHSTYQCLLLTALCRSKLSCRGTLQSGL